MKNVVIGTAGHVDHGKTLLVKALTGIDTDRLKEEKKRGITIELGFACLPLPDGGMAGIVDVPGHEKFIRNMLAGAGGIDLALLVVAADDGVMPQTREHLEILSLLGIKDGIVAVTKIDLVEPEWIEMVIEDIRQEVKGTFLESAPIQTVSSTEGTGLDELKSLIFEKISMGKITHTSDKSGFRLPVDRVFSVDGFGTVITGTLIEGTLNEGCEVEVYPSGIHAKIRNLQVYSKDVATAFAGQRVAVNLARLKKDELVRGDILALPGSMKNSMMLDVKLNVLKNSKRVIGNGTTVHFYHGASEKLCKLVLLEHDRLCPGDEGYAQLRFSEKIAAKRGDRFVIRFYSPVETVGGGIVLDPNPAKHRRKLRRVLDGLHVLENGTPGENILQTISRGYFVPLPEVRQRLLLDKNTFKNELDKLVKAGKISVLSDKTAIDSGVMEKLAGAAEKLLGDYHKDNPLQSGMRLDEFRSRLLPGRESYLAEAVAGILEKNGTIVLEAQKVRLKSFNPKSEGGLKQLSEKIETVFKDAGCSPPSPNELSEAFPKQKDSIRKSIEAMLAEGILVMVAPQTYFHRSAIDGAIDRVTKLIEENGRVTLAEFRTASDTSRKLALTLLEYFDRHGLTKKVGDARVLARK